MIINKTSKQKQKFFYIEKIKFTSSPPPAYPHPLTTTNHSQKKKKNTSTIAATSKPTTIGPPQITPTQNQITNPPPKTKSQTHQINQPTPISQSYPNQLIPMTIKPLKIAETYPQPRSDFTKPTHSYPRLKACDDSSEAVLRSWWGDHAGWAKAILKSVRLAVAPMRKITLQQKWTMVTKPFVTICPYFITKYIWWRNNIHHLRSVTECIGDENVLSPIKNDRWRKLFVT